MSTQDKAASGLIALGALLIVAAIVIGYTLPTFMAVLGTAAFILGLLAKDDD